MLVINIYKQRMKQDNLNASKKNLKNGWFGSCISCDWEEIHNLEIFIYLNMCRKTCILVLYLWFLCHFEVWNSQKTAVQTIIYHYSTIDGEKSLSSHQKKNNSRFSNSITNNWLPLLHRNTLRQNRECHDI